MKKINSRLVFQFIIIYLTIVCFDTGVAGTASNIVSDLSESISLNYWQIVIDPNPNNIIQIPHDSLWQLFGTSSDNTDQYAEGNWLLKTNIVIDDSVSSNEIWGFFPINLVTAYEIYWDGIRIAQNGKTGFNKREEKAGQYNFYLPLNPHLVNRGNHTLIIRISNHHNYSSWKWFYGDFVVGPFDAELKNIFRSRYQAFFISGILLIPFLFNLFLYFARKRKTDHLLFSLICFIVILDSAVSLVPALFDVQTTYIYFEYYAYHIITLLFTALFPVFFIYSFALSKKFIPVIILADVIIYLFLTNAGNVFDVMSLTVLIISSIIILWALFKRLEGSLIIFIGLIAAWTAYYFNFAFGGLASTMVICTSFSIARQFARKEKAEREAMLRSAQLENQLLKKNINPHFILNTLTSIIVWLRKDPSSAIKLIEALATEFRMIIQISPLKQIPIHQEIDLCNAHLKIMSYRKGADYRLETAGIVKEENVPPMIFHTLIENGLTHGYENKIEGTFTLQRRKNSDCLQYVLSNDGDFKSDEQKDSSGFGLRYIRSRLEESYPDRWKIISHRQAQGWETIIEIKD